MTDAELIAAARAVLAPRRIGEDVQVGSVASALLSGTGRLFTGICIDTACSLGFCAEHAAVAAMLTAGEDRVARVVAVGRDGIMAPCGRCRELLWQLGGATTVILPGPRSVPLAELLPGR